MSFDTVDFVGRLLRLGSLGAAMTAGVAMSGCSKCPTSELVAEAHPKVSSARACALSDRDIDCELACGDAKFNRCWVEDATFDQAFSEGRYPADGGVSDPKACPSFEKVTLGCYQYEQDDKLVFMEGCAIDGRRPAGMGPAPRQAATTPELGQYLARSAYLEAASVLAFEQLARELAAHGAPDALIRWASRAADEERGHARAVGLLASKHGASHVGAPTASRQIRSLFDIALDNTVEGEVRETYAALLAAHRAACASDPAIRAAMQRIAEEECSHAAFSRALASWLASKLDADQRLALARARRAAIFALREELRHEPSPDVQRRAGVPGASVALFLLDAMVDDGFMMLAA